MPCIKFFTRSVYGQMLSYIHPDDPMRSVLIRLLQTKTISSAQMETLKELGLTFEQVLDPKSTL